MEFKFCELEQFESYRTAVFIHPDFKLLVARISAVKNMAEQCQWDFAELSEIQKCRIEKRKLEKITGKWCVKELFSKYHQMQVHIHADSHAPEIFHAKNILKEWYCSISHSNDWVCAVIAEKPIGVDIEKQRFFKPSLRGFFCNQKELDIIEAKEIDQQQLLSLQYFCCKEAILKTIGRGIAGGPQKANIEKPVVGEWCSAEYEKRTFQVFFTRPDQFGISLCLETCG